MARYQHIGWRVTGIVAMPVFLVTEADFQAVFMALGTQQADLDPGFLDQCVEGHGGAVDAQVAVANDLRRGATQGIGHLCQAVADGQGAVLRGRRCLEQLHVAVVIRQDEIGEGAAGVDAQTILLFGHDQGFQVAQRGRGNQCAVRKASVAASSTWPSLSITTPYSRRAPSRDTRPLRTSFNTLATGRRKGLP